MPKIVKRDWEALFFNLNKKNDKKKFGEQLFK